MKTFFERADSRTILTAHEEKACLTAQVGRGSIEKDMLFIQLASFEH